MWRMVSSYPESTNLNEFGNKVTGDVEGNEGLQAADADPADESSRSEMSKIIVGRESGDLVVIQLDDGWVNSDGGE